MSSKLHFRFKVYTPSHRVVSYTAHFCPIVSITILLCKESTNVSAQKTGDMLSHCDPVPPYGIVKLGQHWFRPEGHYVNQCWLIIGEVLWHSIYCVIIMSAMAFQITNLTIVYSTVYSGADQRKHPNSMSLAFVWGIHLWPVNSAHKGPVTRKMLPFDDVSMSWGQFQLEMLKISSLDWVWKLLIYQHMHSLVFQGQGIN